ncbi:uncharacterized protein LOC110053845 [Orbicella faveolata]|uniref:uncharacterized protein LOC110053845 n=1 Tax=Orbicella faveolata TaxID=48498 RepID=UPI0009E385CF|nr:uncharacterized protein LOC110053845 [Orbicella faveolata]
MDTALVLLISNVKNPVNVFGVSSNCHKCGLQLKKENLTAPHGFTYNITVPTNFSFTLAVYNAVTNKIVCPPAQYSFEEHGLYSYKIHAVKGNISCKLVTNEEPDSNVYWPLLYAFLAILGAAILWNMLLYLLRRYNLLVNWKLFHDIESLINADLGSPTFNGPESPMDHDDMVC